MLPGGVTHLESCRPPSPAPPPTSVLPATVNPHAIERAAREFQGASPPPMLVKHTPPTPASTFTPSSEFTVPPGASRLGDVVDGVRTRYMLIQKYPHAYAQGFIAPSFAELFRAIEKAAPELRSEPLRGAFIAENFQIVLWEYPEHRFVVEIISSDTTKEQLDAFNRICAAVPFEKVQVD